MVSILKTYGLIYPETFYLKRMKHTVYLKLIIVFFSACTSFSEKVGGDDTPNNSPNLPQNAIPVVYSYYIFIDGFADNVPGSFILDTGTANLHFDSLFHRDNIFDYKNLNDVAVRGIGNTPVLSTRINDSVDFRIGGSRDFRTTNIWIHNLKQVGGDDIDGLVGTAYFKPGVLEINYANEYILVYDSIDNVDVSAYNAINLERIQHFYCMEVTINVSDSICIKGAFILDTGMPFSTFTNKVATSMNLYDRIDRKVRYFTTQGGVGGESSGYDFIIDQLDISGYRLSDVNMSFSEDRYGTLADGQYLGIIGNNVLDRFDLLFDFNNDILYLKPNESFNQPYVFDRLGFSYVNRFKTMGGWIVTGITDNSRAEKEGLKVGDKIISVNGTPVESISLRERMKLFNEITLAKFDVMSADRIKTIEFELIPLLD